MSSAMHAVAWLELDGDDAPSNAWLELGTVLDFQQPPFDVWTETADYDTHTADEGCFHFATGAGGFLQAMVYGYGGVRYRAGGVELSPQLPPGYEKLTLRGLHVNGTLVDVVYDGTDVAVSAQCSAMGPGGGGGGGGGCGSVGLHDDRGRRVAVVRPGGGVATTNSQTLTLRAEGN